MDSVAERIFALADKQFFEQKEFAQEIGETPSKVSQWRTGITRSYIKKLPQIATVLGTTTGYLLTGEKKEPDAKGLGLSPAEQSLIDLFRLLSAEQQDMVIHVVEAASGKQKPSR